MSESVEGLKSCQSRPYLVDCKLSISVLLISLFHSKYQCFLVLVESDVAKAATIMMNNRDAHARPNQNRPLSRRGAFFILPVVGTNSVKLMGTPNRNPPRKPIVSG